ncbi:MAG: hypothetical protein Fur0025_06230 [Oscillatoriaceae cyanobacterium]
MKLPAQLISQFYLRTLRHPTYRWGLILGTFLYLFSPIDLSPDLLPLLGQIDDIAIVMLLINSCSQIITEWLQNRGLNTASFSEKSEKTSDSTTQTIDVDAVSID